MGLSSEDIRRAEKIPRLVEDAEAWQKWRSMPPQDFGLLLDQLYGNYSEFRSLMMYRFQSSGTPFDGISHLRPANDLYIRCPDIGGGFRIQHGHSTWVMAESIGRNFFVNQNVTIGVAKGGKPVIGDDVQIRTGAVVVGPIRIGNGVMIAPTAFVNFDVPSGKKVFPARAIMV